jgi:mannose-6-phosphate isomerase-like protein (cupin superfamily)
VQQKVIDVEQLKKQVRKIAAGRVLAGQMAEVGQDLARIGGCQARIQAGYGQVSKPAQTPPRDRFLWILDGLVEVHDAGGHVVTVSQGEGITLPGTKPYRLRFPNLTLYLYLEAEA